MNACKPIGTTLLGASLVGGVWGLYQVEHGVQMTKACMVQEAYCPPTALNSDLNHEEAGFSAMILGMGGACVGIALRFPTKGAEDKLDIWTRPQEEASLEKHSE